MFFLYIILMAGVQRSIYQTVQHDSATNAETYRVDDDGAVTSAAGFTATTGGFTATAGDVTATTGALIATAGNVQAIAGDVLATSGTVQGAYIHGITGTTQQGTYVAPAGAGDALTAAELIDGYTYIGTAAGGGSALTMPDIADVQAALLAAGIVSAAGLRLPPALISEGGGGNLTVTAGAGGTVVGTAAVNNATAVVHTVFTAAATAHHIVVQD
jgi:hypothetical protein